MARPGRSVRVLVVDDSALARDLVSAILESDPEVTIAGQAANGLEAVSMVLALKPDIVTMDIEMPVLGGLEAIGLIMAQHPTPILVVTGLTGVRTAFAAVSKGALDVVEKPDLDLENGVTLIKKVKLLARVDVLRHQQAMGRRPSDVAVPAGTAPAASRELPFPPLQAEAARAKIVAIAASTGGPRALQAILSGLPAAFPVPVVISQHVADGFAPGLAEWLNGFTPLKVSVARKGDILEPGRVYLNPPESSMRITRQGIVLLSEEAANQLYHPSCDVMLGSVAEVYREGAVGLILTGMGDDGVAGMRAIKAAGGVTLAQDEKSSVVYGMNGLAVKQGCVDRVTLLADIPASLARQVASAKG